jgi:hypothetical protein
MEIKDMHRDKHIGIVGAAMILLAGQAPALTISTTAISDFSVDDDGWVVQTISDNGAPNFNTLFGSPDTFTPTHNATGGDPGGFISMADPNDGWTYFVAPSKYLVVPENVI